eukprot:6001093-Amphidinium_carterae.1
MKFVVKAVLPYRLGIEHIEHFPHYSHFFGRTPEGVPYNGPGMEHIEHSLRLERADEALLSRGVQWDCSEHLRMSTKVGLGTQLCRRGGHEANIVYLQEARVRVQQQLQELDASAKQVRNERWQAYKKRAHPVR